MTPQDHNKAVGVMHLIYGGLSALVLLIFVPLFIVAGRVAGQDPQAGAAVMAVFLLVAAFFLAFFLLLGLPPLIAGYGLLKRKPWARTWAIISSVLATLNFPFGTALAVYSFWFLFGEGKTFYEGGAPAAGGWLGTLGEGPGAYGWDARGAAGAERREAEYAPPPQPPDWRG